MRSGRGTVVVVHLDPAVGHANDVVRLYCSQRSGHHLSSDLPVTAIPNQFSSRQLKHLGIPEHDKQTR
jgi:hypothetical protein